ncbi:MAG: hypothetical protein K0A99_12620 [Desulfoarculaceae bacterium]|nr:hypothetical protein [Desulfoarculaceae bacterium]
MSETMEPEQEKTPELVELKIQIPPDLYVAYQRCSWTIVHEVGSKPLEVMEEMVRDFLIKHGC